MSADLGKRVRDVVKLARKAGWDVRLTRNSHWRFQNPDGRVYFTGSTPKRHSAYSNMRADLRRLGLRIA